MVLLILLLLLTIPAAILVAWLARDELIDGRRWLFILTIISAVSMIVFFVRSETLYALYSIIVLIFSGVSWLLSYRKGFAVVRKR
jgi:hypothetical protein